ncbi:MAG TPA: hypothetical protein PLU58_09455 [Saprospiraceae bacterium]|nr:hypothetical protein [Saprospiraceae bacterium]HQW96016.1 hypothetical protein [Saprospiraceae bacterium]
MIGGMKGKMMLMAMALGSMGLDGQYSNSEPQYSERVKTQLNNKQSKARSASKRARKARRINRK